MDTQQTPRLKLNNHLFRIRKAQGLVPIERGGMAHFQHLHDEFLHEVDGEECYEVPLDLVASYCVKHKDDIAAMDAIGCVIGHRGIGIRVQMLRDGATAAADLLFQHMDDETQEPAQSFVRTAEGKTILPLDLAGVVAQYGHHHAAKDGQPHQTIPFGGKMSHRAIEVLDEFLAEIGLQPNHPIIRQEFCATCRK